MKTKVWNIGDRVTQIHGHYKGVPATVTEIPTFYGFDSNGRVHVLNDAQPGDSATATRIRQTRPNNLKRI